MKISIIHCERCSQDHVDLEFQRLTRPMINGETWTHWAPCPTTGEPIMLRVQEVYPRSPNRPTEYKEIG